MSDGRSLRAALRDARQRTLAFVEDLDDAQMIGPRLEIVNPLLWEIGHVAWFQERWTRRHLRGLDSQLEHVDRLYDSMAVPHETRWDLKLIGRQEILDYMRRSLEDTLHHLPDEPSPEQAYFHQLALFHEDMHCEAFAYTRQTLGYPAPGLANAPPPEPIEMARGDAEIQGGVYELGARPNAAFAFDNEKWAHPVQVGDFAIARTAVTEQEYLLFVEDGGYGRPELWSEEGWRWRQTENAEHPLHWRETEHGWQCRYYDHWRPMAACAERNLPMVHVGWHEAEAYCRWAGRRLPSEAEWELAASGMEKRAYPWAGGISSEVSLRANLDCHYGGIVSVHALGDGETPSGVRQMMGNVWEWTGDDFGPFPGFTPDPYKDYSQPWFGDHKVLRGGCWATRFRMLRNTWRNFYKPERRDVWAGFRTCALG